MKTDEIKKLVGRKITHHCPGVEWRGMTCHHTVDAREVTLMAVAGNYAMVRRPRAMPYVAPIKELKP